MHALTSQKIITIILIPTDVQTFQERQQATCLDADYDGISRSLQITVPLERENYNKFQDADGCPDILHFDVTGDADGDGIMDNNDLCPFSLEIYNKFQDADGCPDYVADNKIIFDY